MRYTKWFASIALAAGMAVAGTTAASAQDWRDVRHDSARIQQMNADIARDRARLNEDIRRGRQQAAARDAADLARDQRALNAQLRDVRHDVNGGYGRAWR
jgi:hypothetical protein